MSSPRGFFSSLFEKVRSLTSSAPSPAPPPPPPAPAPSSKSASAQPQQQQQPQQPYAPPSASTLASGAPSPQAASGGSTAAPPAPADRPGGASVAAFPVPERAHIASLAPSCGPNEMPALAPRELWMPDADCTNCYECGAEFGAFVRRHHCRVCGRVFCGHCTENTIPSTDGHKQLRVCTYCFVRRLAGSSVVRSGASSGTGSKDDAVPRRDSFSATRRGDRRRSEVSGPFLDPLPLASVLPSLNPAEPGSESSIPLRRAAHEHLTRLVQQELTAHGMPNSDWVGPLVQLAERVTAAMAMDARQGDPPDIRSALKIKRVPGGRPSDTQILGGIVCTKNVTDRRMRRDIATPRLLLLSSAVDFERSMRLASLETVLQQEAAYMRLAVARIVGAHPDIVLCGAGVARVAQDMLLAAGVTLVLHVKSALLARIAAATGARLCATVDDATPACTGSCARVRFVPAPHGPTFCVLDGCTRAPSITVVLRGASLATLTVMKAVLRLAVFAAAAMQQEVGLLAALGAAPAPVPAPSVPDGGAIDSAAPVPAVVVAGGGGGAAAGSGSGVPAAAAETSLAAPPSPALEVSLSPYVSFGAAPSATESVSEHQFLVFLHAIVTAGGAPPCKPAALEVIRYYGEGDTPVGRFLQEACLVAGARCVAAKCKLPPSAHVRWYVHGSARVAITVHPDRTLPPQAASGVVAWLECQTCDHISAVLPLPDSAWNMSLGRFLECAMASTAACSACGHPVFSAHTLCFGHGTTVARVVRETVTLLEVDAPARQMERLVYPTRLRDQDLQRVAAAAEHAALAFLAVLQEVAAQGVAPSLQSKLENLLLSIPRSRAVFAERVQQARAGRMLDVARIKVDLYCAVAAWHAEVAEIAAEVRKAQQQQEAQRKQAQRVGPTSILPILAPTRPARQRAGVSGGHVPPRRRAYSAPAPRVSVAARTQTATLPAPAAASGAAAAGSGASGLLASSAPASAPAGGGASLRTRSGATAAAVRPPASVVAGDGTPAAGSGASAATTDAAAAGGGGGGGGGGRAAGASAQEGPALSGAAAGAGGAASGSAEGAAGISGNLAAAKLHMRTAAVLAERVVEAGPGLTDRLAVMPFNPTPPAATVRRRSLSSPAVVRTAPRRSSMGASGGGSASLLVALAALFTHSNARTPVAVLAQLLGDTTPHARIPQGIDAVIVQEGEPSSLVAYALASDAHLKHVVEVQTELLREASAAASSGAGAAAAATVGGALGSGVSSMAGEVGSAAAAAGTTAATAAAPTAGGVGGGSGPGGVAADRAESVLERLLHQPCKSHFKYRVSDGATQMQCEAYYACQFNALRMLCNCDERGFIESLSRCRPWAPTGGKSGAVFLKTQNDRFVLKAISRTELESFLAIAPSFFSYMARTVAQQQPSLLLRLYGVYSLHIKRGVSGTLKMDVCVMENLFFNRTVSQVFDLKGSMRSRYVDADARAAGRVLLDENLVELASRNPLLVSEAAKQVLVSGVHRDTQFLARHNIMDYSLLVGVDNSRRLVVGIVDYIRQYTWDKQMETWLKRSAGRGPDPTVISPNEYKERFRAAMDRYFVMVPTKFTYMQSPGGGGALVPRQLATAAGGGAGTAGDADPDAQPGTGK